MEGSARIMLQPAGSLSGSNDQKPIEQAAAICLRAVATDDNLEVLLVASSSTGQWGLPMFCDFIRVWLTIFARKFLKCPTENRVEFSQHMCCNGHGRLQSMLPERELAKIHIPVGDSPPRDLFKQPDSVPTLGC